MSNLWVPFPISNEICSSLNSTLHIYKYDDVNDNQTDACNCFSLFSFQWLGSDGSFMANAIIYFCISLCRCIHRIQSVTNDVLIKFDDLHSENTSSVYQIQISQFFKNYSFYETTGKYVFTQTEWHGPLLRLTKFFRKAIFPKLWNHTNLMSRSLCKQVNFQFLEIIFSIFIKEVICHLSFSPKLDSGVGGHSVLSSYTNFYHIIFIFRFVSVRNPQIYQN